MTFQVLVDPRRVADRLSSLTGRRSLFSGVPDRVYRVGPYTVTSQGTIVVPAEAPDGAVLRKLISEGLILPEGEHREVRAPEPLLEHLSVSFPMHGHKARTLTNLIYLMYCRGEVVSKATGGCFHVDDNLVVLLRSYGQKSGKMALISRADVLRVLGDYAVSSGRSGLEGLRMDADAITFDGFRSVPDEAHRETFERLAAAIVKMALRLRFVRIEPQNCDNDRYKMRIFLMRCMSGKEYKADRMRLLAPLSGCSSRKEPPDPKLG